MRCALGLLLVMCLSGCAMYSPMTPRLSAEDQHQVDRMWDNMLTPADRLNRQTLLDTDVQFWLYTCGVDRLRMKSEKYFKGGTAVMEIDCDRANPDADEFSITVLDGRGRTVRRERYSRAEVEASTQMMLGAENVAVVGGQTRELGPLANAASPHGATTGPENQETPEQRAFRAEFERRHAAAEAATQPAGK